MKGERKMFQNLTIGKFNITAFDNTNVLSDFACKNWMDGTAFNHYIDKRFQMTHAKSRTLGHRLPV